MGDSGTTLVALRVAILALLLANTIILMATSANQMFGDLDCIADETAANVGASDDDDDGMLSRNFTSNQDLKIALLASFVAEPQKDGTMGKFTMHQNIINKACYAKIWGYDFIFDMTSTFTEDDKTNAPWLNFAGWNRVPQMQAILDDYDWVLYGDLDHTFRDLSRPLESFLKEFELYNQHPSVFLPTDKAFFFTFSSYVMLLKNDPFGKRLLKNWMRFGRGMCDKGNLPMQFDNDGKPKYSWEHSDQPGLWYALVRTYEDFYKTGRMPQVCNDTTGYIDTTKAFSPETNKYFKQIGMMQGHHREPLLMMKDQPIIWSTSRETEASHDWGGLGLQMNWGQHPGPKSEHRAFALHKKKDMDLDFRHESKMCQRYHGCFANYNADGKFEVGCNGKNFTVLQ